MKKLLTILFIAVSTLSYADQLAYITKSEADRAVELISKMKSVVLFCGCCDPIKPVTVKPTKVYALATGYEDYWEVFIEYVDADGLTQTEPLDLAYVWKKNGSKTIGALLGLEHDYCVKPKNWNKPVKAGSEE